MSPSYLSEFQHLVGLFEHTELHIKFRQFKVCLVVSGMTQPTCWMDCYENRLISALIG